MPACEAASTRAAVFPVLRCRRLRLNETDLLACVPQRKSLVVFPKRDRAYRESIVGKLRDIEADARHPLTFELFSVSPSGIAPFAE